jgi:transcription antitermination factor NusG
MVKTSRGYEREVRCDACKKLVTGRMQVFSVLSPRGFHLEVCAGCRRAIRREKLIRSKRWEGGRG